MQETDFLHLHCKVLSLVGIKGSVQRSLAALKVSALVKRQPPQLKTDDKSDGDDEAKVMPDPAATTTLVKPAKKPRKRKKKSNHTTVVTTPPAVVQPLVVEVNKSKEVSHVGTQTNETSFAKKKLHTETQAGAVVKNNVEAEKRESVLDTELLQPETHEASSDKELLETETEEATFARDHLDTMRQQVLVDNLNRGARRVNITNPYSLSGRENSTLLQHRSHSFHSVQHMPT